MGLCGNLNTLVSVRSALLMAPRLPGSENLLTDSFILDLLRLAGLGELSGLSCRLQLDL